MASARAHAPSRGKTRLGRRARPQPIDTDCVFLVLLGGPSGAIVTNEMGTLRVDVGIENPLRPGNRRVLRSVLVDTGAELSWFPRDILESLGIERRKTSRFRQATGTVIERSTGMASVYLAGIWTVDEVVFGEPGDLELLGSRSLEGLNLRVDPVSKQLIDAGPAPAAAFSSLL